MKNKAPSKIESLPAPLRLLVYLYGFIFAPLLVALFAVLHYTCKVEILGEEWLEREPRHILALWHPQVVLYLVGVLRHKRPQVWLNHDVWFMQAGRLAMSWLVVRHFIHGSSGNSGRKAAAELLDYLRTGKYSTWMTPDGPHGPLREAKKGVFHLSKDSALPIIGIQLSCSRPYTFPSWDRKLIPLPFSTVTIKYSEPFQVTEDNFEEAQAWLPPQLG